MNLPFFRTNFKNQFFIPLILLITVQCSSIEFYRMELFETLCVNCGIPELDCSSVLTSRPDIQESILEMPVGSVTGERYYIAQGFGEPNPNFKNRFHVGEDWNLQVGGDSDFAAPVYSIGQGIVSLVGDFGGGWGKVIRICHRLTPAASNIVGVEFIESIYAHLYDSKVNIGDVVNRGEWIGGIGNSNQAYSSHLHFEVRSNMGERLGGGYESEVPSFFLSPSQTILKFYNSKNKNVINFKSMTKPFQSNKNLDLK
jgi:murein DD-endopeptidase MepM/ murein hydrolase activator NlpD